MAETGTGNNSLGRKVFFINPTYTLRTLVIPELRMMEFDLYIIDDYTYLKNILYHNPDAICLIGINGQLSTFGWYALVEALSKDAALKGVTLGVLSDSLDDATRDMFLNKLTLQAGAIALSEDAPSLVSSISDILTFHNAKGRRQHVRVNCLMDKNAAILWLAGDRMFELKMLDISVVGAALVVPPKQVGLIQPNSVIRNATLKMGNRQYAINFLVYGIHQKGNATLMVTFFMQDTPVSVKEAIKEYIYDSQQKQLMQSISGEGADPVDYVARGIYYAEQAKNEAQVQKMEARLAEMESKEAEHSADQA